MSLEITGLCPLLQVYDMPTSIHFYRDLLAFEVITTSPPLGPPDDYHWCLLANNGSQLMLNTAYDTGQRPPTPDPARVRTHNDTCLYLGCIDADATCATLRAKGLKVRDPKVAPYGMKQLYLHDPDGYNLCYQHPA